MADTGYDYVGNGGLTLADFTAPRVQTVQVGNGLMPFANTPAFENAFLTDLCNPPTEGSLRFSGPRDERNCRASNAAYEIVGANDLTEADIEENSENAETVYAGYAMATAEVGALTALGGSASNTPAPRRIAFRRPKGPVWRESSNSRSRPSRTRTRTFSPRCT